MLQTVLGVVQLAAFWALGAIFFGSEYLDWFGRLEVLEVKHPRIHRFVIGRPLRIVLLLLFFGLLAENTKVEIQQLEGERDPPPIKLTALPAPEVCKTNLLSAESHDSLRRRTIRLVDELNLFWSRRAAPARQPVQSATSDEDRKLNAAWDEYWRTGKAAYLNANYRERLVGIVREYKNKGVQTGFMEQAFDQPERLVGAAPYGGWQLDNCAQYMNELCQLRELAFHVNAQDQRIDPPDF